MNGSLTLLDDNLLYIAFSIIGISSKNEQEMKFRGRGVGHYPIRSLSLCFLKKLRIVRDLRQPPTLKISPLHICDGNWLCGYSKKKQFSIRYQCIKKFLFCILLFFLLQVMLFCWCQNKDDICTYSWSAVPGRSSPCQGCQVGSRMDLGSGPAVLEPPLPELRYQGEFLGSERTRRASLTLFSHPGTCRLGDYGSLNKTRKQAGSRELKHESRPPSLQLLFKRRDVRMKMVTQQLRARGQLTSEHRPQQWR